MSSMMMTPQHPDWDEFVNRLTEALAGPTAIAGNPEPDSVVTAAIRGCNGHGRGAPFESARAVLLNMDVDVAASLAFFEEHGGYCDCEILLNVPEDEEEH